MNTIRRICDEICFFDVECVPDVEAGRRMLKADAKSIVTDDERVLDADEASDFEVAKAMLEHYSDSRGFMKSVLYRIVSIAAVIRKATPEGVALKLFSIPNGDEDFDEARMIERFLSYLGKKKPQVVGFASQSFDLTVLWQRAIVNGVSVREFVQRPAKPWDDAPDYFARDGNDYNVDLLKVVGTASETVPRLAHIAAACRIPAKLGVDGSMVADLWADGRRREIVDYNECDALTTYLLWLQVIVAHGYLTAEQVEKEKADLDALLTNEREQKAHIGLFQDTWHEMNGVESESETATAEEVKAAVEQVENPIAQSLADMITGKQLKMIRGVAKQCEVDADAICAEKFKCGVDELSKKAASELIDHLQSIKLSDTLPSHTGKPKAEKREKKTKKPEYSKPLSDDSTFVCTNDDCKDKGTEFPLCYVKRVDDLILCAECGKTVTRTDADLAF